MEDHVSNKFKVKSYGAADFMMKGFYALQRISLKIATLNSFLFTLLSEGCWTHGRRFRSPEDAQKPGNTAWWFDGELGKDL